MEDRSGSVGVVVVAAEASVVPSVAAVTAVSAGCSVVVSVALTKLEVVAAAAPHPEKNKDETRRGVNI